MFPNEGDLSDRDLLLPAQKLLAPDCNPEKFLVLPPPHWTWPAYGDPEKFLLLPPPHWIWRRLTGIPKNSCYYPPPHWIWRRLMGIPKNVCYYPPPTESGRPAEIMEKWPPPNKNPGYAVEMTLLKSVPALQQRWIGNQEHYLWLTVVTYFLLCLSQKITHYEFLDSLAFP